MRRSALFQTASTGHRQAGETPARFIAFDPNAALTHFNRGNELRLLGRKAEALAAYQRAIAQRPDYFEALINLGVVLSALRRTDEAVAVVRRALELRPAFAEAHVNLAIALQALGESGEAMASVERALAINPALARAWLIRSGLKTFAAGDPDIVEMERLVAGAANRRLGGEERQDLEFALGKAWMDIGDADRAFAHLGAGNRLRRASISYDVRADSSRLAAIGRAFTPDLMRRFAGAGDPSDLPVFIVGMPRSGTTLVEQILASHRQVHGAGELTDLQEVVDGALPLNDFHVSELSDAILAALGRAYIERLKGLGAGKLRIVDKQPDNFQFAALIHLMLPHARIIHCRRDPIDTCLSCYSKNFAARQRFAYDLRELGLYYRAYDQLMSGWRDLLPPERFIEVRYEDVVGDLGGQARRMIAFCGLEWDQACLTFHETRRPIHTASVNQVRQPLYRTSVERWRRYASHLEPLFDALNEDFAGRKRA